MAPIKPPPFLRLQTRLTVLYAGLFALALLLVSLAVYGAVSGAAKRSVRAELAGGGAVFDRIWNLRADQLQDGAALLARDFGFRSAFASGDAETIDSALENLRSRLDVDQAFIVAVDGALIARAGSEPASAESGAVIAGALAADEQAFGVVTLDQVSYQAISAPILSPTLVGWVVFASKLDDVEMRGLEQLSSIPLEASVLRRGPQGWVSSRPMAARDQKTLDAFVEEALQERRAAPGDLRLREEGASIALVKPLRAMESGSASVLVLRYPLARALAPYRSLLGVILLVGLASLMALVVGSWMLARTLTRPIAALDDAAQRLHAGEDVLVEATSDDEVGRLAKSFNLMAAEIRARERRITHQALHDGETGLPNRLALERAMDEGPGVAAAVFVASCGVDRFAEVRGAIGHSLASRLIGELGKRLAQTGLCGAVGRLSSDVLGAVFSVDDAAGAEAVAARMIAACEAPLDIDGALVDIAFSVGLAGLPLHGDAAGQVIDRASIALDQARRKRLKIATFDAAAYGDPAANLSLMSEMLEAMAAGLVQVHYQPKYDLRQDAVVGAEALVRWTHPVRGPLAPELFVGMAEETGQIRALTDYVLDQVIEDQAELVEAGHDLKLSVNLSGRLLGDPAFGRSVLSRIKSRRGRICFEITETAVIENEHLAFGFLDALAEDGIEISIDDYGSGLSSLSYLKRIRAGELKVDKAFISGMAASQRDALLVRSTIDLAHSLGMQVTAEGVEDEAVLSLLRMMGCDLAQGFGVARPMPIKDLLRFMDEATRTRPENGQGGQVVESRFDRRGPGLRSGRPNLRPA